MEIAAEEKAKRAKKDDAKDQEERPTSRGATRSLKTSACGTGAAMTGGSAWSTSVIHSYAKPVCSVADKPQICSSDNI